MLSCHGVFLIWNLWNQLQEWFWAKQFRLAIATCEWVLLSWDSWQMDYPNIPTPLVFPVFSKDQTWDTRLGTTPHWVLTEITGLIHPFWNQKLKILSSPERTVSKILQTCWSCLPSHWIVKEVSPRNNGIDCPALCPTHEECCKVNCATLDMCDMGNFHEAKIQCNKK